MDATPPCGSGMRGAHCKQTAVRPADNSPSRRHFHTRAPTLPVNTVYTASGKIASAYPAYLSSFHEAYRTGVFFRTG